MKTMAEFTVFTIAAGRPVVSAGMVFMAVLFSGCATPALWRGTSAGQWVPGEPQRICLFTTQSAPAPDVGIFFFQTEITHEPLAKRPVLWRLSRSPTNLVVNSMAITAVTNLWRGVRTIPLYPAKATLPADQTTAPPGFAVLLPDNQGFTLHLDGYPAGPHRLPTSNTETQVAARIIGMPLAVGFDAALIAAAVLCASFLDYATSGSGCD